MSSQDWYAPTNFGTVRARKTLGRGRFMPVLNFADQSDRGKGTPRNSLKWILGVCATVTVIALGSTFAANINLNTGNPVEFGQGVAATTPCSNGNNLTVTPYSTFTNASGGGAFYFTSISVSNIPSSCDGVDFQISVYNTSGGALPIFGTSKTVATIWDNSGSFEPGHGSRGSTVVSSEGSFTVTFTVPAAQATDVARFTIQSSSHTLANCADDGMNCVVGATGPGGGTIFYVNDAGFAEPGSACGDHCHNLEWAVSNWEWIVGYSGLSTGDYLGGHGTWGPYHDHFVSSSRSTDANGTGNQAIGAGFMNTLQLSNYTQNISTAQAARAWAANDNSAGQWFIPSLYELREIYLSSASHTGFQADVYSSSSERDQSFYWVADFGNNGHLQIDSRDGTTLVRPIRAF